MRRILLALAFVVPSVALLSASAADAPKSKTSANGKEVASPAERLVREALLAELAGDNARRNDLLAQALKADSNCRAARWQSGYVNIGGKWMSTTEAAQRFSADLNIAEYRRRRDEAARAGLFTRGTVTNNRSSPGQYSLRAKSVEEIRPEALSPAGVFAHADLARWCRSKQLFDEERAHWTQVLLEHPKDSEAESRLGLRWFRGGLFSTAAIDAIKQQQATEDRQLRDWKPIVANWRKVIGSGSRSEQSQATEEMRLTNDPAVIPALEWAIANDASKPPNSRDSATLFQHEAIGLLGHLPEQRATYALTIQSVLAPESDVRTAAATELKKRSLHDFVPVLLAGLANPINFEYSVTRDGYNGAVNFSAVISQEGRDSVNERDVSEVVTGSSTQTVTTLYPNRTPKQFSFTVLPGSAAAEKARLANGEMAASQSYEAEVKKKNNEIELMNRRIDFVLETVSGNSPNRIPAPQDDSEVIPDSTALPSTADSWWTWWDNYNEKYIQYEKPVYASRYSYSVVFTPTSDFVINPSCFAAGTPVQTVTGPSPVDKLQVGDRVLAQDAETGEILFKPVLGTTVRPPVEMVRVSTTAGSLKATRGHPFWIVGKGWRMAKELQVGDRLHSIEGSVEVTALGTERAEKAYNLIVADFGSYFVGAARILVHDNTQRLPTRALLPGLNRAE